MVQGPNNDGHFRNMRLGVRLKMDDDAVVESLLKKTMAKIGVIGNDEVVWVTARGMGAQP